MNQKNARFYFILAMFIYGTIGLFIKSINLPSSVISMLRGAVGAPFLLLIMLIKHQKLSTDSIKRNAKYLFLSGTMLGFNWILLFESYRFTSVSNSTLCYYMAPIFLIIVSPFVFKEKLSVKNIVCVLAALIGMIFVSGVVQGRLPEAGEMRGLIFGLLAAVLYTSIMICNKGLKDIGAFERTIVQLGISAFVMLVYNLLNGKLTGLSPDAVSLAALTLVCVVHTGVAYYLYFGSMQYLPAKTIAILSYIDPVVALILSAVFLGERIGIFGVIGAILILGSAYANER